MHVLSSFIHIPAARHIESAKKKKDWKPLHPVPPLAFNARRMGAFAEPQPTTGTYLLLFFQRTLARLMVNGIKMAAIT